MEYKICNVCKENKIIAEYSFLKIKNKYDKICKKCKSKYTLKWFNKNKDKAHLRNKEYHKLNKDKIKQRHTIRIEKNKLDFINYKGGKCKICGYNKCVASLEFHHINPDDKDNKLMKQISTRSLEIAKVELDKCDLLCSNCHREIHYLMHKRTKEIYK